MNVGVSNLWWVKREKSISVCWLEEYWNLSNFSRNVLTHRVIIKIRDCLKIDKILQHILKTILWYRLLRLLCNISKSSA